MIRAGLGRSIQTILIALAVSLPGARLAAQIIAIGPPSFQSTNYPSLETTILDRLALGGQPDSQDLATLSHLTVLESIAMLADVQVDLANSPLGMRLEGQIRQLWDTAAIFEEDVSANPLNAQTLSGVQPGFNAMQAAYRDLESTLGGSASLTNRAAAHMAGISRLTSATSTLMGALESEALASVPTSARPVRDLDRLDSQVRVLASGIVALVENVKLSKHPGSAWSAVTRDLNELFALVQSVQKTLTAPAREVEIALNAVRRRMWRVEARIARLGWPTDLERQWRKVREQLNLISDEMGLPRVFDRPQETSPAGSAPAAPASAPPTRIYRGPPR